MNANLADLMLAINSPLATPDALNYRPPRWPPTPDWPVIIDDKGEVVSRWGDSVWRLDPWAGKALSINFGDGRVIHADLIDAENANLLRIIAGWWIWGVGGVRGVRCLIFRFACLRPIFALCSREGILASDLIRFPRVAEQLPEVLGPSFAAESAKLLHALYERRDTLGFTLLDRRALAKFEAALPKHEAKQTPYIPPRIWLYQVHRLGECIDDFLAHRDQVEACFRFCLDAYSKNFGSLAAVYTTEVALREKYAPFCALSFAVGSDSGRQYHGPFDITAAKFGIAELLIRWVGEFENQSKKVSLDLRSISGYLTLVSRAGLAYVLNHSMMRIDEAWNLRSECLRVERDPQFGNIYTLRGETKKTLNDNDALWVTSPSVASAIEAMTAVASLRMICAKANPMVPDITENIRAPYLQTYIYEPWVPRRQVNYRVRPNYVSYHRFIETYPKLFNQDELRITQQDLDLARLVTPSLDTETFAVGEIWRFAWHQLRRTGAVNMQASGLVSDASMQFQLKHVTRAMSLYYGRGYSRARLNAAAESYYISTLYDVLGKAMTRLADERYVSPHGVKRKMEIVRLINPRDAKKLIKAGSVACREILLGYCTNREPCPYGGLDSAAHCGGGDAIGDVKPCPDVLYDREKILQVKTLDRYLDERLAEASSGSPLQASLMAQKRSVRNFLDVIDAK